VEIGRLLTNGSEPNMTIEKFRYDDYIKQELRTDVDPNENHQEMDGTELRKAPTGVARPYGLDQYYEKMASEDQEFGIRSEAINKRCYDR